MKINVVKDKNGKVIATFEKAVGGAPSLTPVLEPGQTTDEMDVPENYKEDIKTFYEKNG
jgi:hypothetical protein